MKLLINGKDFDLAAVLLDGVASLKGIPPVFTAIVASVRSVSQLREDEFKEKLTLFLTETDAPKEDIRNFLKLLDKDAEEFFKRIVFVLDRIEDKEKATILGKLLKATILGKIEVQHFKKLSSIVLNTYLGTILYLREFSHDIVKTPEGNKLYPDIQTRELEASELVAVGLLMESSKYRKPVGIPKGSAVKETKIYNFSFLGIMLFENGL